MRVIGIDPGTVSFDLCGLDDGSVFLDRSIPTAEALSNPSNLVDILESVVPESGAPLDLVAGPSGYGLPLTKASDLTESDLRLVYLASEGEPGGIGGLRAAMRALGRSSAPVVLTPGVIHLASVPAHRKVNRVDMGTADKVCAAALAFHDFVERNRTEPHSTSFILLELGGAFTAAVAIEGGRIVDGLGGTSGPIGPRSAGALDGEVAFLAGTITKSMLFQGGAETIAGGADVLRQAIADLGGVFADRDPSVAVADASPQRRGEVSERARIALSAYVESALKAVAALAVSAPRAREVILSGRYAGFPGVRAELESRLRDILPRASIHVLTGFTRVAKQAAQGAALIADGLAGGRYGWLVQTLGIREASGTVLDHLYVIDPAAARARLR